MDKREDISRRLQFLEEKFEYQDQTIDILNDVVIEQQRQLTALAEEMERLKDMLKALGNGPAGHLVEPPPPHY